jgi:hypothetical protein
MEQRSEAVVPLWLANPQLRPKLGVNGAGGNAEGGSNSEGDPVYEVRGPSDGRKSERWWGDLNHRATIRPFPEQYE